jgi:hypothetical protein
MDRTLINYGDELNIALAFRIKQVSHRKTEEI